MQRNQRAGLPGLHALRFALCAPPLLLLVLWPSLAQRGQGEGQQQAGIVIQFDETRVATACIDLGSDGQASGMEVLEGAGFAVAAAGGDGSGVVVCKVDSAGCAFPDESCFCQCSGSGESCRYWSYYHLEGTAWTYAQGGAGGYTVQAGAVEGWAWGDGSAPPVITYDEICPAATPTPTPSPSPSPSPSPTAPVGPEFEMLYLPVLRYD